MNSRLHCWCFISTKNNTNSSEVSFYFPTLLGSKLLSKILMLSFSLFLVKKYICVILNYVLPEEKGSLSIYQKCRYSKNISIKTDLQSTERPGFEVGGCGSCF